MPIQVIWGCEPHKQFEVAWIYSLLDKIRFQELIAFSGLSDDQLLPTNPKLLVESGLLCLEKYPDPDKIAKQKHFRIKRINALSQSGEFTLVHISDEEGFDADELYPLLPTGTIIWRNFPHFRLTRKYDKLFSFPIGPRQEFLSLKSLKRSTERSFPWAFMGTIWPGGSRFLSTSLFLRGLPSGYFFGGNNFGVGLPIAIYKQKLGESIFALCPEGDRHLDTFRLYESLEMGCIPLVVDYCRQASSLLGENHPIPLFDDWYQALRYASSLLSQNVELDSLQDVIQNWWSMRKKNMSNLLLKSIYRHNLF